MNRDRDSDEESSVALFIYVPKVADIPDLVNLIADYCDDAALSKLSRVVCRDKWLGCFLSKNITKDNQS